MKKQRTTHQGRAEKGRQWKSGAGAGAGNEGSHGGWWGLAGMAAGGPYVGSWALSGYMYFFADGGDSAGRRLLQGRGQRCAVESARSHVKAMHFVCQH